MLGFRSLALVSGRATAGRCTATRSTLGAIVALAALAAWTTPTDAQPVTATATAARPNLTSSSAEAREAFAKGLDDVAYLFNARGASQFARAVAADSSFGLARALYAAFAPGLDSTRRVAEASRAVADAAHASTGELLLATAARELVSKGPAAARPLFRAVSDMYPSDALFATWAATIGAGRQSPAQAAETARELTRRFPTYGAPYNTLAYTLFASGDSAGALDAAKRQVDLAPTQPNVQDSYGEMLQWNGRLDDAAAAYGEAARLAPTFSEAFVGLAEVRQLQRRSADARTALTDALRNAQGIGDSLRYMTYLAQNAVYGNDLPGALRGLGLVAQTAEQRKLTDAAALAHANLAVVAALMGDKAAVARHSGDVSRLLPSSPPQIGRTLVGAYIVVGMTDSLRAIAARNDSAFIAKAAVALVDGKPADALQSLAKADSTAPLVQELSAEAHAKMGHADIARAAQQRLLARRDLLYYNDDDLRAAVALRRAEKMKP
jgi:tetratricopeptide (TPR) repeat protein